MGYEPRQRMKDPAALTVYEAKLAELKGKGLSYAQIASALGGSANEKSVASKFKVIREKLHLQELERRAS